MSESGVESEDEEVEAAAVVVEEEEREVVRKGQASRDTQRKGKKPTDLQSPAGSETPRPLLKVNPGKLSDLLHLLFLPSSAAEGGSYCPPPRPALLFPPQITLRWFCAFASRFFGWLV